MDVEWSVWRRDRRSECSVTLVMLCLMIVLLLEEKNKVRMCASTRNTDLRESLPIYVRSSSHSPSS